jgi:hypothetical protein
MREELVIFNRCIAGPFETEGDGVDYQIVAEPVAGTVWLFFQGTVTARDWANNFDFPIAPYKNMPIRWYAHRGLARMYKSARDVIMARVERALESIEGAPAQIRVAGYSQGAALAVLAHEDIGYSLPRFPLVTYAFAPPRVVWMLPRSIRGRFSDVRVFWRRGDIVPMVPPWIFGYQHVGGTERIGEWRFPWWRRHLYPEYQQALE